MRTEMPVVIDCETCPVRHVRCDDCLVTALARTPVFDLRTRPYDDPPGRAPDWPEDPEDGPTEGLRLDAAERRAVDVFVRAGLVDRAQAASLSAHREDRPGVRAVG